jgi:ATP-dependent DNA ligase
VAKRRNSTYQPGRRSRDWIKTAFEWTTEVIIAGWHPGEGRRAGTIGSLLLAAHDNQDRLVYVGQVGTGFTQHALRLLQDQLAPLAREMSPYDLLAPASTPAAPTRSNRSWSARSPTAPSHPTDGYGTPPGAGCAPTETQAR